MKLKIIKTEADYQAALAHVESLMDARPGTPEEEELEKFAILVEAYEQKAFPISLPDPVTAIRFRMEQQGLMRKDLKQYIGSQSKVSEVLNGKCPLSLSMIRALHAGLGIPAEVLLREPGQSLAAVKYNYREYPFSKMFKCGYFKSSHDTLHEARLYAEELLTGLFASFQGRMPKQRIYCHNSKGQPDKLALQAWQARVLALVAELDLPPYHRDNLNGEFLRDVVKLSSLSAGPVLARERLQQRGISLVILSRLPQTYLDGACFKSPSGHPVIGLTLRHDRLDNFWFTLAHELAHMYLHLKNDDVAFFDETEGGRSRSTNSQEIEADTLAANLLIPTEIWRQEKPRLISKKAIETFARRLSISPAIVAGRLRWEADNYNDFGGLLGSKAVRKLFKALPPDGVCNPVRNVCISSPGL
ncbi:MAG: ImmA/IrrE family metallo-endopeptidase [Gammaproteobacteria bacterium]|nr:ImmA/IrrE family metallo-endopeptidase [Gammaproteobacteria bacterium]